MSSISGIDHQNSDYCSQPRGFLTPPPTWRTRRCSPAMPWSEKKAIKSPQSKGDLFHVIHKVPSGDSPYVRAKHVQLIDKDPSRAISLFWAAINSGDRVDSALKDMAVVMKQLDRSDEAIEAIKSFRHLCPPESQESLDNILVELYKQVEEGMAFGGKRTKMARSQGKKVQITVEKEYSRKALSFESDKNKQCNLAICLMHLNKLTEAKFLLQAIRGENGHVDESHVKSYERASQMLAEFESQRVLNKPMSQTELKNESGIARGCCDANSPLPLCANKTNGKAFTEFPYEKRADFDWRRNNYQPNMGKEDSFCNRSIPKVPLTQPRRCLWSGDPKRGVLTENARARKLSFGSNSENAQSLVNQNVNYVSTAYNVTPNVVQFSEKCSAYDCQKSTTEECDKPSDDVKKAKEASDTMILGRCSSDAKNEENLNLQTGWKKTSEHKKSWADMVEEDEQTFGRWRNSGGFSFGSLKQEGFNDENMDSNIIIPETPNLPNHQAEKLSQEIELIDLGSGYFTQPGKTTNNQSVRRSLCFDQNHKPETESTMKVLNFEGQEDFSSTKTIKRRNRLQVFQDITQEDY
ncbi:hypothetical protein DH2020_017675 [Rehmannia glutinosa]|uniref:Uncharacterized protein n=1 Tax=Rehmannia glutinosa TaxID=99300 RepID=A0ABR0WVU5_REHGL